MNRRNSFLFMGMMVLIFCVSVRADEEGHERKRGLVNEFFAMDTATGGGRLSTPEQVRIVRDLGYAGIGYWERKNTADISGTRRMIEELEKNGLGVYPIYISVDVEKKETLRFKLLEKTIELLAERGEGTVWLSVKLPGSGKYKPSSKEFDDELAEVLKGLCEKAGEKVRIALYPHANSLLERIEDAVRVIKKVESKNLGLTFNLCHWLKVEGKESLDEALELAKPYLFVVTINGADSDGRDWDKLIQPLGEGSFDVYKLMKKLHVTGYKGPVGFQGYGIKGDIRENLKKTMEAWRELSAKLTEEEKVKESTDFKVPTLWEYSAPLIAPEKRDSDRSRAQKDPTVVFYGGKWHVFMTVKLPGKSAIEYCLFKNWEEADKSKRTILDISKSNYYCAPQVFYFTPHKKWYLVYQMGVPGASKMWVAYSATTDIFAPDSWTQAAPILDGGEKDPRKVGGLDYWIVCDEERAYLFLTSLNGKMWRLWTRLEDFPRGFDHCELALDARIFEASHTYKLKGMDKYLTVIEEDGRRYYKAYLADRLDGEWVPVADTAEQPFAGWKNVRPAAGVEPWTDNISHGELIRDGYDQTLMVDPGNLRFIFQGMWDKNKSGKGYGQFQWRIGMLTPVSPVAVPD